MADEKKTEVVAAPGVYCIGDGKFVNYDGIPCNLDGKGLNGEDLSDKTSALEIEKRKNQELLNRIAELEALAKK
jgi:hypothetical protein